MKMISTTGRFLFAALFVISTASCSKENDTDFQSKTSLSKTSESARPAGEALFLAPGKNLQTDLQKAVFSANAKYNSSTLAIMDGYQPDDHCVSVPGLGGMGYHWVNPSLVDGTFDPLKPEVLLYARGPGGTFRLIGVEYIVVNVGQPVPMFDNQAFQVGGTPLPIPHWSLHAWIFEPNPSGMFAPFNPNVTCP